MNGLAQGQGLCLSLCLWERGRRLIAGKPAPT